MYETKNENFCAVSDAFVNLIDISCKARKIMQCTKNADFVAVGLSVISRTNSSSRSNFALGDLSFEGSEDATIRI